MQRSAQTERKAIFMMICCVLMWSTGGIFIKSIPWNSFMVAGSRSFITVFMISLYMKLNKIKFEMDRYSICVSISICISFFVYVPAMQMTTAANVTLLSSTHPLFIILITALFYKKVPTKQELLVVALCIVGVSIFFFDDIEVGGMLGNILALVSSLAMSIVYTFSSKTKSASSSMSGLLCGHILTATIGLPIGLSSPLQITPTIVATMIIFAIINTGMATYFYNYALRNTAPLNCSLIGMLEIILGPLWVFLLLGEVPSSMAFIGGSILTATIVWWCVYSVKIATKS